MARVIFYLCILLLQIKTYGVSPITDDHDDLWGVPSLNELGFDTGKIRLQYLTEMYSSNE